MTRRTVRHGALVVVAAAFTAVVIPAATDSFWLSSFTAAAIYAVPVASCGLLYGRLGMVSLAQVGFLGVGAWVALRMNFAWHIPFVEIALAAGVVTAVIGLVVTLPALRLTTLHFALITLMAAGAAQVFFSTNGFPNGGSGFFGVNALAPSKFMARPGFASSNSGYFRFVVCAIVVLGLLIWLHTSRKPGRSWALIRESAPAAQSVGIDVRAYSAWAVALASFVTGVAGALYVGQIGLATSENFDASASVVLFAVALMGGAYSLGGAVMGGALGQLVPALLVSLHINGNVSLVLFGIGLLATLTSAPLGVAGQLGALTTVVRRRRRIRTRAGAVRARAS